jgi:hypothetical protein
VAASNFGPHNAKPLPSSPISQKIAYIRDKYELRKYVRQMSTDGATTSMWLAAFAARPYCCT